MGDATYATEDDNESGKGKDYAYKTDIDLKTIGKGGAEGVTLNDLIGHAKGDGDENGKKQS